MANKDSSPIWNEVSVSSNITVYVLPSHGSAARSHLGAVWWACWWLFFNFQSGTQFFSTCFCFSVLLFFLIFYCHTLLICLQPLPVLAHQLLNGVGDLLDLLSALQPEARVDWRSMNRSQFEVRAHTYTHLRAHIHACAKHTPYIMQSKCPWWYA